MEKPTHPEPMFARENFFLLDGKWEIYFDNIGRVIRVPYCPESVLSGIGFTDFIPRCRYRTEFIVEEDGQGRLFLHFGAVNYRAEVRVNGKVAGTHFGGYTPFSFDITKLVRSGANVLEVFVQNDLSERNPSGKQSPRRDSFGCFYTRCTGIWQSVRLERVPDQYLKSVRFFPDIHASVVRAAVCAHGKQNLCAEVRFGKKIVGTYEGILDEVGSFTIPLSERHLWDLGKGDLYDVTLRFGEDTVHTYFGLREVKYEDRKFLLNGRPVFERFVLDQGYYPDGVYTPADRSAFARDIRLAKEAGFNGARLHQKVFDPLYLYECDRAGFLVWGEYPSWGVDYSDLHSFGRFVSEWREAVERDFNHPCIVTWCPLNETWGELDDPAKSRDVRFVDGVYAVTKIIDPTRPCVDVSGGMHGTKTDVVDFHCYDVFPLLKRRMDKMAEGEMDFLNMYSEAEGTSYGGEPLNLSEFGGVSFGGGKAEQTQCIQEQAAWGYDSVSDEGAFAENYDRTVRLLLSYDALSGFCYTQLYDVEQEQNGLYRYDRTFKFSRSAMEKIASANAAPAAIEKEKE